MCLPEDGLLRHVTGPRPRFSDMYFPEDGLLRHVTGPRPRFSDMYLPEDGLLRHVIGQPTLLQRHVPPGGRATATCDEPAGPAPATCTSHGTGYCGM